MIHKMHPYLTHAAPILEASVPGKISSVGFIAAAAAAGNVTISAIKNSISSHKLNIIDFKLTLAHAAAIIFVSFISLISLMLGRFATKIN